MDYKKAMDSFRKHEPKLTIVSCIDYDKKCYVIEAVENLNEKNYNSPFYAVDKHNGNVYSFIPSFNIKAFMEASKKRTVYRI